MRWSRWTPPAPSAGGYCAVAVVAVSLLSFRMADALPGDMAYRVAAARYNADLDRQPQLGRDVFARPPGALAPRVASYMRPMEACLTVLERDEAEGLAASEAAALYRIVLRPLFRVSDALARIREHLALLEAPVPLSALLPRIPPTVADHDLVCRSAVASTLVATLELARNGEMTLSAYERFEEVSIERNSRI